MVRTQVSLTERQMGGLRALAAERGISLAAALREAVDDRLAREERRNRRQRALEVVAALSGDGPTDLAEGHDRYLDEAFRP